MKAPAGLKFENDVYVEWFDDAEICVYMLEKPLENFWLSLFDGFFLSCQISSFSLAQ